MSAVNEELSFIIQSPSSAFGSVSPPAAPLSWLLKIANYTAISGDKIATDTSGGIFTITLPLAPLTGDNVELIDATNSWETNNLVVARNGQSIGGSASNLNCDTPIRALLIFVGGTTGWGVY